VGARNRGCYSCSSFCHREERERRGDLGGEALRLPRPDYIGTRNDTDDITQCHTMKMSSIYLNEPMYRFLQMGYQVD